MTFTKRGQRIMSILGAVTVVNTIAVVVGVCMLGGDARSGFVDGEQHFVGNHGVFNEVTSAQWYYSYYHVQVGSQICRQRR